MSPAAHLRESIAQLAIQHPDPDGYDAGWNAAIHRVVDLMTGIPDSPATPIPRTPLQRRIVALLRDCGKPLTETELREGLFPSLPADHWPHISGALGALTRHAFIRRVAGRHNCYVLT